MRELTYAQAIREAINEEMRKDETIIFMGEDIGVYGGCFGVSVGMLEEFGPERILETPISELGFTGAAVGAAMTGLRPIIEYMFSDFVTVAMDQIINQAAKNRYMFGGNTKVPMVIRTPGGSGTGAAAQHSQSLEALYTHIPGLKVVMPSTPFDAKGLLKTAIRDDNPVVFLENKLLYKIKGEVPEEDYTIPLGKADIKRCGKDITLIVWGRMVQMCLNVAENMSGQGIEIEVVDLRSLLPLDTKTIINSAKKTGRILVVHESVQFGGFGGEIVSTIADSDAFYYLDAPIKRLGGMFVPIPYNPNLEKGVVPSEESISKTVRELLAGYKKGEASWL